MMMTHFYRRPGLSDEQVRALLARVQREVSPEIVGIETEVCFHVEWQAPPRDSELRIVRWLLSETFLPEGFATSSFFPAGAVVVEVGPRLNFTTAWCTNALSIFQACGISAVSRIERSRRYLLRGQVSESTRAKFLAAVHDRMTEYPYDGPLRTFDTGIRPEPVREVPVLQQGRAALEQINRKLGLAFDEWDLDYYTRLFVEEMGRNPTDVECFDIAQSNSEHSRHWFFKGRLIIDGVEAPDHLIGMIQSTLQANPRNSVIAFRDNSSAIRGFRIRTLHPARPGQPCPMVERDVDYDILFTAETHNFPSGVAPFPGAETGTGGRIRDVHATGRGSLVVAGTAAYCVGNLHIPGYPLPWEDPTFRYPGNLASPLQIEIEASNGASDYGNKFGEPVIQGYTRSFGLRLPNGERREWIKPIMFSGGIGQLDAGHREKSPPEPGMWVVKIGGPAYRIGMGGGAASSMVQGENVAELDFNAVQRGDAEMEQKVNRVIRACVELGDANPIVSIHDQGAGGNCNVLKEIVNPAGARIEVRRIPVGDQSLSVLEIWGAEYQEQDALLLRDAHVELFRELCRREKVPVAFVGRITGDGRIVLHDEWNDTTPVNLELEKVLGKMPRKVFESRRIPPVLRPLELPPDLDVRGALERVLRLLSVGSKRFLTTKVDRSVTGLVARQQCAGPLQLTVADVAVIAQSHFGITGAATAIGEQPILSLLDPAAMARMSVGEALTNLVWAPVTHFEDIKCSGNWMWAAKMPGEGAAIYDAARALQEVLIRLGIAIDGGKDSVSMAARAPAADGGTETVKAPGSLVISAYVTCPDITRVVTPDLKLGERGVLLLIDLGRRRRLGGSALAQVFGQLGEIPPDLDDPDELRRAFETVQELIAADLVASGHDRSDGGLITTLLEMAFAGDCGFEVELEALDDPLAELFAEELGLVLEVDRELEQQVLESLHRRDLRVVKLGRVSAGRHVVVRVGTRTVLDEPMPELRDLWEETSYRLDLLQADPDCAEEERRWLGRRRAPDYHLTFRPEPTPAVLLESENRPRVAIIREEGSNGDREMTSAFHMAGFETWDVSMFDLVEGRVGLDGFRGVAFVGGFSYADVLDSAKGWAGVIRHHPALWQQFEEFYHRPDTFSLGVCNGCQLMALLGWIPWRGLDDHHQPRFIRNRSGRFESRFVTLRIEPSPAVMLRGMEGSRLGVWCAHGEGRAFFPATDILQEVLRQGLAPLRYSDESGQVTLRYPDNPNGSVEGIAGLCSPDGRHLALMPHPERSFLKWQWPWMPRHWHHDLAASPWLRLFQNARSWCDEGTLRS